VAAWTTSSACRHIARRFERPADGEAEFIQATEYGDKYRIRGTLIGPNGRRLKVVSFWMTEEATGQTKFLTLRPEKDEI
jgi:hypothetical protein